MGNIANVDTPGYKRKYTSFEDAFRKKLAAASYVAFVVSTGRGEDTPPAVRSIPMYSLIPEYTEQNRDGKPVAF